MGCFSPRCPCSPPQPQPWVPPPVSQSKQPLPWQPLLLIHAITSRCCPKTGTAGMSLLGCPGGKVAKWKSGGLQCTCLEEDCRPTSPTSHTAVWHAVGQAAHEAGVRLHLINRPVTCHLRPVLRHWSSTRKLNFQLLQVLVVHFSSSYEVMLVPLFKIY